jgi:hypothetical protein
MDRMSKIVARLCYYWRYAAGFRLWPVVQVFKHIDYGHR